MSNVILWSKSGKLVISIYTSMKVDQRKKWNFFKAIQWWQNFVIKSYINLRSSLLTNCIIIFIMFTSLWDYIFLFLHTNFFLHAKYLRIYDIFVPQSLTHCNYPRMFTYGWWARCSNPWRTLCKSSFRLNYFFCICFIITWFLDADSISWLLIWQFCSVWKEMGRMKFKVLNKTDDLIS